MLTTCEFNSPCLSCRVFFNLCLDVISYLFLFLNAKILFASSVLLIFIMSSFCRRDSFENRVYGFVVVMIPEVGCTILFRFAVFFSLLHLLLSILHLVWGLGNSVGRARDFWSGGQGFDPCSAARAPFCQYNVTAETEVMVYPLCLCVAALKIVRCQSWDPSAIIA